MNLLPHPQHPCRPVATVGAVVLLLLLGCDLPQRPPLDPQTATRPAVSRPAGAGEAPQGAELEMPPPRFTGNWETWDACYVRDQRVGYSHVVADAAGDVGSSEVNYTVDNRIVDRGGTSTLVRRLIQTSSETADGRLIGFNSELHVGPEVTRFEGLMDKGTLIVTTIRRSERKTTKIPWQMNYHGLVAVEQSLRHQAMKEGETRLLKMLLPVQYRMATVRLRCSGLASVPLIDGVQRNLLEVHSQITVDDKSVDSLIWTDESGNILRTYSPATQLFKYRTDRQTATKAIEESADRSDSVSSNP